MDPRLYSQTENFHGASSLKHGVLPFQLIKMKKYIISAVICVFCAKMSLACSCGVTLIDLPIKEMGWTQTETSGISSVSDVIFAGILLDVKKVEETRQSSHFYESKETKFELIFKLIKSYKGDKNDTMKIRTNPGTDACGFCAPVNTECLIFASKETGGYYYTYSSECCKSISKAFEEKRYNRYIKFMESLLNMVDGEYIFYQSAYYYKGGYPDTTETMEVIRYNIKNGKLDGDWQLTDRKGRILEKGKYKNGRKEGIWIVSSYTESDLEEADEQVIVERIFFRNGKPRKSTVVIEDNKMIWEDLPGYKTIRKQKIRKKYKHYQID